MLEVKCAAGDGEVNLTRLKTAWIARSRSANGTDRYKSDAFTGLGSVGESR